MTRRIFSALGLALALGCQQHDYLHQIEPLAVDFNNDGYADVALPSDSGEYLVFLNDGTGTCKLSLNRSYATQAEQLESQRAMREELKALRMNLDSMIEELRRQQTSP